MGSHVKRIGMLRHCLGEALFEAYPLGDRSSGVEPFLAFAVFNPKRDTHYLVPHQMLIPRRHRIITLGVECDAILNPLVIFECWGEESDFFARWDKIQSYRAFPRIQQYIALVAYDSPYVEQHTRVADRWEIRESTSLNDEIQLVDGKTLSVSRIFRTSW